jgi:putative ABC transport system permease protein
MYMVGDDFFRTFDVPLVAGRDFDARRAQDIAAVAGPPTGTQSVVISRALAAELGATPDEMIGRTIYSPAGYPFEVIGVTENRVLSISAGGGPRPRVYLFNPTQLDFHVVRLSARDVSGSITAIDALWKRLAPNVAIKRRFAEDYFNDSYASFARINSAFSTFAAVAVAIATIGLAAIAIAVTNRRRAEIGVRKVLGGNARQMAFVLLGGFGWPVVAANLIAWPLAYAAARAYLGVFIQPIALTALPFVASLALTLLVACLAVARQTWSAARLKPASVLRHE